MDDQDELKDIEHEFERQLTRARRADKRIEEIENSLTNVGVTPAKSDSPANTAKNSSRQTSQADPGAEQKSNRIPSSEETDRSGEGSDSAQNETAVNSSLKENSKSQNDQAVEGRQQSFEESQSQNAASEKSNLGPPPQASPTGNMGSGVEQEQRQARQLNELQNRDRQAGQSGLNLDKAALSKQGGDKGEADETEDTAGKGRIGRTRSTIKNSFQSLASSRAELEKISTQLAADQAEKAANAILTKLWQKAHLVVETFVEDFKIISGPIAVTLFIIRVFGQFAGPRISFRGASVRLIPKIGLTEWPIRLVMFILNGLVVVIEVFALVTIIAVIAHLTLE